MNSWRLVRSGSMEPRLNMALDDAIFQAHAGGNAPPTLRFYGWSPPAVSLGYFQDPADIDVSECRRMGMEVVRRVTGGRAVLHLDDLTYSVVAGAGQGIPGSAKAAYRRIGEALLSGLSLIGIEADVSGRMAPAGPGAICFLHSVGGDVAFRGKKLVGSAQAWQGNSLLQHGSVLLAPRTDPWKWILRSGEDPEEVLRDRTTSIEEILGRPVSSEEMTEALARGFATTLDIVLEPGRVTEEEWAVARALASKADEKLSTPDLSERTCGGSQEACGISSIRDRESV